jgi:hypothetical protein
LRREHRRQLHARVTYPSAAAGRSASPLGRMINLDSYWWASVGSGLFAGLFTVAILGRWLRFVLALRLEGKSGGPDRSGQIRVFGFPLLAFVSPVPWLFFVALPCAAYYFIRVRPSPSGIRFFCSLGVVVSLWLIASAFLILRFRMKFRHRSADTRPNSASSDRDA